MQHPVAVMFVRMLVCRRVVRVIHARAQVRIVEILPGGPTLTCRPASWQDTRFLQAVVL
jgi:hypothetical protein